MLILGKGRAIEEEIEGEAATKERVIYPQEIKKVFAASTGPQGHDDTETPWYEAAKVS